MILNLQIPHAHSIKIKEPCPDAMWCWGQPLNRLGKATELRKFKGILNNAVLDLDSRSIGPSIPAPFSGSSHSHIEVHTNCQVLLALFSNMCSFCTTHMVVYCSLTLNHTMKFEAFMIFFLLQVSQTKKNLMPVFFIRKHQNKVMCSYSGKVRCLCFCQKDNLMSGCDAKIAINSVAVTSLGRCYIATPWPSLFAQTHGTWCMQVLNTEVGASTCLFHAHRVLSFLFFFFRSLVFFFNIVVFTTNFKSVIGTAICGAWVHQILSLLAN